MDSAPCILILDRNPRVRGFLARELQGQGLTVLLARDLGQARAILAQGQRPDVLVCDAESLAGWPRDWAADLCPDLPVVVQAYAPTDPGDRIVCAHALVDKSADPAPLLEAVQRLLARRPAGGR